MKEVRPVKRTGGLTGVLRFISAADCKVPEFAVCTTEQSTTTDREENGGVITPDSNSRPFYTQLYFA